MNQLNLRAGLLALVIVAGSVNGLAFGQDAKPEDPAPAAAQPETAPASETPAHAENPARELFLKAQEAVRQAQSITYTSKYYATGGMQSFSTTLDANVRMVRSPKGTGWLVRTQGTGTKGKTVSEFDVAYLETTNEWTDPANKKLFEKFKRDAKGAAFTVASNSKLEELMDPIPFKNELKPDMELTVEPQHEQGGVMCDVVSYHNGKTKVIWYLGVEDHMPRKRESQLNSSAMSGTMVLELNDLKVDNTRPPRMSPEMVRVALPEGFAEERQAMPPPPPPPVPVPTDASAESKGEVKAQPSQPEEASPPAPVEPETPRIVAAPAFELSTPTGQKVSLASLKGKVVVLEFAGSWCISLREAHPELEALKQQYKDRGVEVYLVNVREKASENMVNDLQRNQNTFGLLLNGDQTAIEYRIKRYPSYCVIDKEGLLTHTEAGFVKTQSIPAVGQAIEAALGNPAAGNPAVTGAASAPPK